MLCNSWRRERRHGTRSQAVTAEATFCTNCINPLLTWLGEVFTARVAPRFASGGERLVVWFEPCRANDEDLSLRKWQAALKAGIVSGDEFRAHVLNLPEQTDYAQPVAPEGGNPALDKAATDCLVTLERELEGLRADRSLFPATIARRLAADVGGNGCC